MKLLTLIAILTQGCYFAAEESDPVQTEDYYWDDEKDEDEKEDVRDDEEKETELVEMGWSLHDMEMEEYHCFDDFYENVEETEMFCRCVVEKVSMRWEYDQYQRRKYTYLMRLNNNGTLKQCLKTPDFWEEDSEEEIIEDQKFNADPEREDLLDSLSQNDE